MFDSAVLEVTIGVLVVFLLVSTICTAIREGIEARLKTRAAYLEAGIRELLQDVQGTGIARAFYRHPVIFGLYSGEYKPGALERSTLEAGGRLPSYVSGRSFAVALLDIVARGPTTDAASASPDLPPVTLASIRRNVATLDNPHLQRLLLLAIDSAEGDIERVRQSLHAWFDDGMGRVSGWYKRSTQKVLFVIALVLVGSLNINTITIAQFLYRNEVARAELVTAAEQAAEAGTPSQDAALGQLLQLDLPVGWSQGFGAPEVKPWSRIDPTKRFWGLDFWNDIVGTALGLFITVFAAMLGAPFWFDVLSRATAIRSTFKPKAFAVAAVTQTGSSGASGSPPDVPPGTTQSTLTAIKVTSTHTSDTAADTPPTDSDGDGDACDHPIAGETNDEDLPPARGGVAPA